MRWKSLVAALAFPLVLSACTGGLNSSTLDDSSNGLASGAKHSGCDGAVPSVVRDSHLPEPSTVHAIHGFSVEQIATVGWSRELAALPNGDLLVGTGVESSQVFIIPHAEGNPGAPQLFATIDDQQPTGIAFAQPLCTIYVGSTDHVWAIHYHDGQLQASKIKQIASVRTGPIAPGSDGDVHTTTSVAYADGKIYVAVGSSCNATMDNGQEPCTEVDPTRAAVSIMNPDGSDFTQRAKRIRNAIAVTVDPQTGAVWVGGAGQDDLPYHHPYEYLDNLSSHPGDADYGWPECEENHQVYWPGYNCTRTVEPLVELPAYSTIIGAAFYPLNPTGQYAFPARYRGGLFATAHGSWHTTSKGCYAAPPRVVFVGMNGDRPQRPVDWSRPVSQWKNFLSGFQSCTSRSGRPTGIAVGPKGSLFVADDESGHIYRIRPTP